MYKKFILYGFLALSLTKMSAQNSNDTIANQSLEEVAVVATRSSNTNDLSASVLSDKAIGKQNFGQNLPILLSSTPSLVTMTDDGLGVGYTYFRIRGTDHTRINMTINGIPLNDSESQTVFWVNMTDFASSLDNVLVQRGVGSSTNGSSSFGASVNMKTNSASYRPYADLSFNGGMYNTFREMLKVSTGLLPSGMVVDAKFSKVNSDGYIDRAFSDLYSYSTSATYYSKRSMVKLLVFGGKEKTYMGWYGISKDDLENNRRFNPAGADYEGDSIVGFYDNQTDNYAQNHTQLSFSHYFLNDLSLNVSLFYTRGKGYYEQFKDHKKLADYGLPNIMTPEGEMKKADIIMQKHLDNHFYGTVFSLNYLKKQYSINFGGSVSNYDGDHFGRILAVKNYPLDEYEKEYYRSKGKKADANVYLKGTYTPFRGFSLLGDLQYRYIDYSINGINDEDLQNFDLNRKYSFFNPKAGITYNNGDHNAYFNFAIANREPSRKNFTEAGVNDVPLPERLFDYELGYNFVKSNMHFGVNLYLMDYDNQLVLTGKYSDTGAYLTKNVKDSYRTGIEIIAGVNILKWLSWEANVTFSRNKILNFTDWFDVYDENGVWVDNVEFSLGNTDIAFSPSITAMNNFGFKYEGFGANIQTLIVGKQYLNNTMAKDAQLPAYSTTNIVLQYDLPLNRVVKNIVFSIQANNIFNSLFVSNGGSYSYMSKDSSLGTVEYNKDMIKHSCWYYAQAGFNIHGGIKVSF